MHILVVRAHLDLEIVVDQDEGEGNRGQITEIMGDLDAAVAGSEESEDGKYGTI